MAGPGLDGTTTCAARTLRCRPACATANHALGEAWRTIKMGDAKVMLAGGAEATIVPIGIGGFCAMKALSTRNDDPKRASRPFDKERDGFVMGEGSGVVVLEELEHAKARGARIYAEIVGYGNTADANDVTAPSPGRRRRPLHEDGPEQCRPQPGGHLLHQRPRHFHTPRGHCGNPGHQDGLRPPRLKLAVSSTKGATGHMLGAAGAVETVVCVKAIQTDTVPPTINDEFPDPECDLDYAPKMARPMKVNVIVNNSFGFGGHNASTWPNKFVG